MWRPQARDQASTPFRSRRADPPLTSATVSALRSPRSRLKLGSLQEANDILFSRRAATGDDSSRYGRLRLGDTPSRRDDKSFSPRPLTLIGQCGLRLLRGEVRGRRNQVPVIFEIFVRCTNGWERRGSVAPQLISSLHTQSYGRTGQVLAPAADTHIRAGWSEKSELVPLLCKLGIIRRIFVLFQVVHHARISFLFLGR